MSFQHISDTLISVIGNAASALSPDGPDTPLKDKQGIAGTVLALGLNQLGARAVDAGCSGSQIEQILAEAGRQFEKGSVLCESPIERMMLAALITAKWPPAWLTMPPLVHDIKADERLPVGDLVIVPQMAFVRYRFDFGLIVEWEGARHTLAIECDGADYHGNYLKERHRELYLASWGIPVFRFSGRDINKDPHSLVDGLVTHVCGWKLAKLANLSIPAIDLARPRV